MDRVQISFTSRFCVVSLDEDESKDNETDRHKEYAATSLLVFSLRNMGIKKKIRSPGTAEDIFMGMYVNLNPFLKITPHHN